MKQVPDRKKLRREYLRQKAVVNLKGELIGLTSSLAAVDGYDKSAGFAIPFDDLTRRIVQSLVAGQEVEYGMLGIVPTGVTPTEFRRLGR